MTQLRECHHAVAGNGKKRDRTWKPRKSATESYSSRHTGIKILKKIYRYATTRLPQSEMKYGTCNYAKRINESHVIFILSDLPDRRIQKDFKSRLLFEFLACACALFRLITSDIANTDCRG